MRPWKMPTATTNCASAMSPPRRGRWFLVLALWALLGGGALGVDIAWAEETDGAVEAGRRALSSQRGMPWYDSEQDTLRRIDVPVRTPAEAPKPGYEQTPTATPAPNLTWWRRFVSVMEVLFWVFVVVLVSLVAVVLIRAFLRREASLGAAAVADHVLADEADRIEQLPFPVRKPQADLLAEARRWREAGDLREATIYLYSYMLVELDRHDVIRLTKGKTNRQYLRETHAVAELAALLYPVMVAFEDVFFGEYDMPESRFAPLWDSLAAFEHALQGTPAGV